MISYSSYCFSKRSRNSVMLCSSKCKIFEDFEASINIMYRTVEDMMSEDNTLEIKIKSGFLDDRLI